MNRLRDDLFASDPNTRTAARLLRRFGPMPLDARRRECIRLQIRRKRRRVVSGLGRRSAIVATLLATLAGASGMVEGGWRLARHQVLEFLRDDPPPPAVAARAAANLCRPPAVVAMAPLAPSAPAAAPPGVAPRAVVGHHGHTDSRRRPLVVAAPLPAYNDPGTALMMEAIRARQDGDLAGADHLLAAYRGRFPQGALQEEALVLSLEVATLRANTAAPDLARQYLERFPRGRFRGQVEKVLRGTGR